MIAALIDAWAGGAIGLGAVAAGLIRLRPRRAHLKAVETAQWGLVAWLYLGVIGLLVWEVH